MTGDPLETGEWGERVAARHLRGKGYRIVGKRVRVGRRDEIDLVARKRDTLVFVEVKTRGGETYGRPSDAVDARKKRVLSRAAVRYLQRLRKPPLYFRFDVVEVVGGPGSARTVVRHLENAFPLDKQYTLPY